MAYPVVRLDNMSGTHDVSKLRSVIYSTKSGETYTPAGVNNGCVVAIDALTADREVFYAVAPTAKTPRTQVALVATPELLYDERLKNLDDFTNEAGSVARAYLFETGNVFSITTDGVSGTPAVGNIVELADGNKLKVVATATSGSTAIGHVIALDQVGTKTYVVIVVD